MKADTARSTGTGTARGRGTYTPVACNFCRIRKIKCSGDRPTCRSCANSGHECTWGAEGAKKPSAVQYVESLKKRTLSLEAYVQDLESQLERCRREHGGLGDIEIHLRPEISQTEDVDVDLDHTETGSETDNELLYSASNLVLEDRDLLFHGPTSIFRHSTPQRMSRFPEIIENHKECYVLMVEGADESHYNPNFDWSRYLPTNVPLDRREHDRILDLVFKFFTSWCLRIVPALFLRDMWRALSVPISQPPPKTSHYSPMLHNALVALASAFSDDPRIRDLKSRRYFADAAKSYIDAECQMPNICVIHALSILASFHSSQGEQTLGYTYFGMSARISQALGLGVDCSTWVQAGLISHDDRLDRNWAYWTTFSQDVCWSLYVGRDFCVPCPSSRNNIPVPFVEKDFDELPWHHPPSGISPQPGYLSKTFASGCELLLIARPIMDVVNSLSHTVNGHRRRVKYELVSEVDVQLNSWKDSLPQELNITLSNRTTATPHKIMLHLAYWWLFILLHRPFYRRPRPIHSSDAEIDHVKLCNRAAEHIMELLGTWRSLYGLRYAPITLVQVVFSAGTVYLLSAVQATSGVRVAPVSLKHSLDQAELCMQYLSECGRSWECANTIKEILRNLLLKQLEPRLQRRNISIDTEIGQSNEASVSPRRSSRRAKRDKAARSTSSGSPKQQRSHSRRTPTQTSPPSTQSPSQESFVASPDTSPSISSFSTTPNQPLYQTFEWPYPAPVRAWQPTSTVASLEDEDTHMSYSMEGSGFLGMPGGEMLSEQPFISFEIDDYGTLFEQNGSNPEATHSQDSLPPLDLTEADLRALQQLFESQAQNHSS